MWWRSNKQEREYAALDASPSEFDLTGRWRASYRYEGGDIVSGATLEQHGNAVFGHMQCKFAADAPLTIRGIVFGNRLIANYWRAGGRNIGSGLFDLVISTDGKSLIGTSTWHNADGADAQRDEWHWTHLANV